MKAFVIAGVVGLGLTAAGVGLYCYSRTGQLPLIGETARAERSLAGHAFWKAPIASEQLESLLHTIETGQRGDVVFIDDAGKFALVQASASVEMMRDYRVLGRIKPAGIGRRWLVVDLSGWTARPARQEVVKALRQELDAAEFRPVPKDEPEVHGFPPTPPEKD